MSSTITLCTQTYHAKIIYNKITQIHSKCISVLLCGLPYEVMKMMQVKPLKGKGQEEYLYSALSHQGTHKALRHGSHSFTCKQHHACLSFVAFTRCHHHSKWGSRHPIAAHYSFIDPERMKGWVEKNSSVFFVIRIAVNKDMRATAPTKSSISQPWVPTHAGCPVWALNKSQITVDLQGFVVNHFCDTF